MRVKMDNNQLAVISYKNGLDIALRDGALAHASGQHAKAVKKYIEFLDEKDLPLGPASLQAYVKHLRVQKGRAPETIRLQVGQVRLAIKRSIGGGGVEDMLKSHIALSLDKVKLPKPAPPGDHMKFLTPEEMTKFFDPTYVSQPSADMRIIALSRFLYSTGARISEAVNIMRADVDYDRGYCTITITGKGEKTRTLRTTEKVIRDIEEAYGTNSIWLFPSTHSGPVKEIAQFDVKGHIDRTTASVWIKERARNVLNVNHFSAHGFRHSFVMSNLGRGISNPIVSKMAGHSSPNTTNQYYVTGKIADADWKTALADFE